MLKTLNHSDGKEAKVAIQQTANTVLAIDNRVAGVSDCVASVGDRVRVVDDRVAEVIRGA
jgi:phage-related minor tail protein